MKIFGSILTTVLVFSFMLSPFEKSFAQQQRISETEQLDFASGLFERGLYRMAGEEFRRYIHEYPQGKYLEEAYFGLAESYFFGEEYRNAENAYKNYQNRFRRTDRHPLTTFRIAQSLYHQEGFDQADEYISDLDPRHLPASLRSAFYFYQGRIYQEEEKPDEALESFQRLIEEEDASAYMYPTHMSMAEIYLRKKQYDRAAKSAVKALESAEDEPQRRAALMRQGEIAFQRRNYSTAADVFDKVLSDYGGSESAHPALVNLLLAYQNLDETEKLLSAFEEYSRQMKTDGEIAQAFLLAADVYARDFRYDKAQETLERLLQIAGLEKEIAAKANMKKAEILFLSGQPTQALDLIGESLENQPFFKDRVIFLKAEIFYELEENTKAYKHYKNILDNYPRSEYLDDTLFSIGFALRALEKEKEALEAFERYAREGETEERKQTALYNAYLLALKLDLNQRAVRLGEEYLAKYPERKQREWVLYTLGKIYYETNQNTEAVRVLERRLKEFPQLPGNEEVRFLAGLSHQKLGNSEKALSHYQKISTSTDMDSYYYSALKNTALVYLDEKRNAKAIEVFDRILTGFDRHDLNDEIVMMVADHYFRKEKYTDVLRVMDSVITDNVQSRDIALELAVREAESAREVKDYGRAGDIYQRLLSLEKRPYYQGLGRLGLAKIHRDRGEINEAEAELNVLLETHADDDTLAMKGRMLLAGIKEKQGNPGEAVKVYLLVSVLYNDDEIVPAALYKAGKLLSAQGKAAQAATTFQNLVEQYGEHPLSEKARLQLERLNERP